MTVVKHMTGALTGAALALMMSVALPAFAADQAAPSLEDIVQNYQQSSEQARQRDMSRLNDLLDDREQLEQAVTEAEARQQQAQERRDSLDSRRQRQESAIADINKQRSAEGNDLQPMFDRLRRQIDDTRDSLHNSWLTLGGDIGLPELQADSIASTDDLEQYASGMSQLIARSAQLEHLQLPVAGQDGNITQRDVVRLGGMSAFSEGDLLRAPDEDRPLSVAAHTPGNVSSRLEALADGDGDTMVLDPTNGEVLQALAQQPSLVARIQQGGVIGYITLALGAVGLLIALAQFGWLALVSARTRQQARRFEDLRDDNPLGRVLKRFGQQRRYHEPEVLEARMDEMLLAEQPGLERGQAVVKVIAAIAPLMGLLGTVTGMIGTFQAITVFGSGDPKMMAGGISQALVTTVLGLVVAIPLLFANTALNSRSRNLMNLLERQASAHLADRLDEQQAGLESDTRRHGSAS
ncbi:outer membrane transport energization protein ExbB [Kushneria avicenniae]|uniref:Outer membrane transport energization protein ExbB n=1 Tax=Kushneria avicenniae TaxID=402385 RepID=A0A1I1G1B9_9GAMM|nr:MotA/TolQ/ExbB proton channel family protein [Kushneria avicenniae]SFC03093.1 outer membrane transport energization protein ExbB [Kushneria avicenniae]